MFHAYVPLDAGRRLFLPLLQRRIAPSAPFTGPPIGPRGTAVTLEATTSVTVEQYSRIAELTLAVTMFFWGALRVLSRPFVDEQRFKSLKRKSPELAAFMRQEVFKNEFDRMHRSERLAARAVRIAKQNAEAMAQIIEQQHAQSILLASLPHMSANLESMSEHVARLDKTLEKTNDLCLGYGEKLARHDALLGTGNRRVEHRRLEDRPHDESSST